MAAMATENGAKFILDTSGKALSLALDQGGLFLVKPSLSELGSVVGKDLTPDTAGEAAMSLVTRGKSQYVAATLGSEGALLASADGLYTLPAERVAVRSAVGAGDAFLGALTWSLMQGETPIEAFHWGVAAGSAAVTTSGMDLARKEDVVALHARYAQHSK
jgi:6-phosphofructokinase 2